MLKMVPFELPNPLLSKTHCRGRELAMLVRRGDFNEIVLQEGSTDPGAARKETLEELAIDEAEVTWIHPLVRAVRGGTKE